MITRISNKGALQLSHSWISSFERTSRLRMSFLPHICHTSIPLISLTYSLIKRFFNYIPGRSTDLFETRYIAHTRHCDVLRLSTEARQWDPDADNELYNYRINPAASTIEIGWSGAGSQAGRRQQQCNLQLVIRSIDAATSTT